MTSGITSLPRARSPQAPQPRAGADPDSDQHPLREARNHAPSGHQTTANLGTYPKAQALKGWLIASLTAHPQNPGRG